jgi:oxidoreductase
MQALVIGATGAIGRYLVAELLQHASVASVHTVTRREYVLPEDCAVGETDLGKLTQHVIADLNAETLRQHPNMFQGTSHGFCCLGTTRADAGSEEAFLAVDKHLVLAFAELLKDSGSPSLSLVSSQGAKANSWFLYMRTKGEVEEACRQLAFEHCDIYRPGLLGRGKDARTKEKIVGLFTSKMPVHTVANAMLYHALGASSPAGYRIWYNRDIKRAAKDLEAVN